MSDTQHSERTGRGERFGIRWGLAGGVALRTIAEVRELAAWADGAGFDAYWVSQGGAVDPVVALAATADVAPALAEVGTSVVPLYGRHPLPLAQAVRTAQSAWGGRFTLGVGPSHRASVEPNLGLSWDRPFAYTRDFLAGLQPLLRGEQADVDGTEVTTHGALDVDAADTPVLLAALGPKMLALAGQVTAGTTVGQCGPRTIATFIRPTIDAAAEAAGRGEAPRIVALVRICVTDDPGPAYRLAQQIGAGYKVLPSYASVLAREGVDEPADLFLIGSWERVLDGLGAYAAAGVTDLRIEVSAPDAGTRDATRAALAAHLGG
ncbi:MAG: TIGR03564 family F420-dependent LLM class oxidoreductase [Acidimicrobiia bacterium]